MHVRTFLAELSRGLSAYVAVVPLFTKLRLWRYVLITVGISVAVLLLIVPLAFLGDHALMVLWRDFDLGPIAANVIWVTVALAIISVELLLFKRIVMVLASPWMGEVSARVEAHLTGRPVADAPFSRAVLARSFRVNVRLAVRELLYSLPFLIALLIPVLNLVAFVGLLLVQTYFVGAGALDYTLERRTDHRAAFAYLRRHRGLVVGVGAGFVAQLFFLIGFLVAPAWSAAAGAYAIHRDWHRVIADGAEEDYIRSTL